MVGPLTPFLNIWDPILSLKPVTLDISVNCSSNNEGVQTFKMASGNLGL